jgi:hypothetical protein
MIQMMIKNDTNDDTKPETLPPIIRRVRCLCENIILYRCQVTFIVLD